MHRKKPRHFVLKRLGFCCYIRRLKVLSEIRTCAEQAGVIAKCGSLYLKVVLVVSAICAIIYVAWVLLNSPHTRHSSKKVHRYGRPRD